MNSNRATCTAGVSRDTDSLQILCNKRKSQLARIIHNPTRHGLLLEWAGTPLKSRHHFADKQYLWPILQLHHLGVTSWCFFPKSWTISSHPTIQFDCSTIFSNESHRVEHAKKMAQTESKKKYGRRRHAGERPFATTKSQFEARGFSTRGLAKVSCEWHWLTSAFNRHRLMSLIVGNADPLAASTAS